MAEIHYSNALHKTGELWACGYAWGDAERCTAVRNQEPVKVMTGTYQERRWRGADTLEALFACKKNGDISKKRIIDHNTYVFDNELECRKKYVELVEKARDSQINYVAHTVERLNRRFVDMDVMIHKHGPKPSK